MIAFIPYWNHIPLLIHDWDGKDEALMCSLLDEILRILTLISDSDLHLTNKTLLHSALSTLQISPALSVTGQTRVGQCLHLLESIQDGSYMIVPTEDLRWMDDSLSELDARISKMEAHNKELADRLEQTEIDKKTAEEAQKKAEAEKKTAEEGKKKAEAEKKTAEEGKKKAEAEKKTAEEGKKKAEAEKKTAEEGKKKAEAEKKTAEEGKKKAEAEKKTAEEGKKKAEAEKKTAEEGKKKAEAEKKTAEETKHKAERDFKQLIREVKELKLQLENLPIWVGTKSIKKFDERAHTLSPTFLTQIIKIDKITSWRTAFTFPIWDGVYEFKVQATQNTLMNLSLGFLRHPLPEDATQTQSGCYTSGIGGEFFLWNGSMWKGGLFKPEGTNKTCRDFGQTAAIQVNMSTREAKLLIDDEEQPGFFTDIPRPLCLGITTGFRMEHDSVEVKWLKRFY
ncbi:putative colicin import membrane protein [Blattamonas nauphoetae]|uniref:Colicin import membrane protein n=1 Tax=Blattamonas nauphoetae TaxID=2049346 RepID=A0ABQ9Y7L8_9EUKA|nr:putative colicin import membrane protein [Blattamonas nauphoetae]